METMVTQEKKLWFRRNEPQVPESKKNINVAVPPELHARVKSAAALRGTNVEGAYKQALEDWLHPERIGSDPLAGLKPKEREVVQAVIAMLRERCFLAETVRVVTKKYIWDKQHGVPEPDAGGSPPI